MQKSILSFHDVEVRFKEKVLFSGLSLDIDEGEHIILKGPSGTGKSTLFNLVLGLSFARKGEIRFKDSPVTEKNVWSIRQEIAYIPQDPYIGRGTVSRIFRTNLGYKANSHLKPGDEEIFEYFDLFKLERDFFNKEMEQLSGGERQRVAIIGALLLKRKVFLIDEITSALDEALKKKVAAHFLGLDKATILCISHDREWEEGERVKIYNLEAAEWEL